LMLATIISTTGSTPASAFSKMIITSDSSIGTVGGGCLEGDVLKAAKRLSEKGIGVNVTLIFSAPQALLAAKAGARYVSPFVGRLDDISHAGMEVVAQIVSIFNHYSFPTEVLVASVRNPLHIIEAAQMGAHIATMPFAVLEQLLKHPLTDIGLQRFLADWQKLQETISVPAR